MKKFTSASIICCVAVLMSLSVVTSCGEKETVSDGPTTADSLRVALANQDSLIALMNDLTTDMLAIKQMENILSSPASLNSESSSARQRIRNDMSAIQSALQQRRERLEELEKKLASSNRNTSNLQKTVETLKLQITQQETDIKELRTQLSDANRTIAIQTNEIDTLSDRLAREEEERLRAQRQNFQLNNDLNTCFYILGTKKELSDNSIIKTGFLRKTRILPGDVDTRFFTKADKRTLFEINCHSKKAEVMTNQPVSSYDFTTEANGQKILVIKNPAEFWKKSDFLVIKID